MRRLAVLILVALGGCSLVVDTSPPDPEGPVANGDAGVVVRCADSTECDDGDPCNGVETCVSRRCVSGTPVECPSNGCLVGLCKPDGTCEQKPSLAACDDAVGCTVDVCGTDGSCSHRLDDARCDDGFTCTRDLCIGQAIAGIVPSGCYSVPDDSRCTQPNVPNACVSSVCAPGASVAAPSSGCAPKLTVACADGMRCSVATAQCEWLPDACAGGCDDGVDCNGVEVCDTTVDPPHCAVSQPACPGTDALCSQVVCDVGTDRLSCATVRKVSTTCIAPLPANP